MTARERLRRARASLAVTAIAAAALWSLAAWLALFGVAAAIDWLVGLTPGWRDVFAAARVVLAIVAPAVVLWRARHALDERAVALWLEEREPALRYALVTLLEPRHAYAAPSLERAVASVPIERSVRGAFVRALRIPLPLAALAALALVAMPAAAVARARSSSATNLPVRTAGGATANRLARVSAIVTPPAYSGVARFSVDEPTTIRALVGSELSIEGRGGERGVSASSDSGALAVTGDGDRWRVRLRMPGAPFALRLRDGIHARLVSIEPVIDSIPHVTLALPARDSVMRTVQGALALAADASDDIGIDGAWFEYIVSSGEGESFTFKSGVIGRVRPGGARHAAIRGALVFDSLQLKPGDIVHLRAVARDGNTVTGPGQGTSETRTLRLPRLGEYDSVAVEAAPPAEADKSALSQRMLIILADSIQRLRPRLSRDVVVGESQRIAQDQARLRKRVAEIVFTRLEGTASAEESSEADEHGKMTPEQLVKAAEAATEKAAGAALDFAEGESPVVHINRPLLEAYNAMWDAGRELDQGEPGRALPHMRVALAAIQRARQAERIYLRGRPPAVVLDIAKVRMTGKVEPTPGTARTPRPSLDAAIARRAARLDAAIHLAPIDRASAVDSLLLLRVDALTAAPALAAAIGDAIGDLRAGRDATQSVLRARRAAVGEPRAIDSLPRWGTTW